MLVHLRGHLRSAAYPLSRNRPDSGHVSCFLIDNVALSSEKEHWWRSGLLFLHDDKFFRNVSIKTKHSIQTNEHMRNREDEALGTVALFTDS